MNNIKDGSKVIELGESPEGGVLTILIAEDHEIVRDGLGRMIAQILRPTVASLRLLHACSLGEVRSIVADDADSLDLILLDLDLDDATAEDCLAFLANEGRGLPVAVVTGTDDLNIARRLFSLGALGFIPKKCNVPILSSAIRLILSGGRYFSGDMLLNHDFAQEVMTEREPETRAGSSAEDFPDSLMDKLTPRQVVVLQLMAEGLSNKEIARRLSITLGTTKNHVASIMRALGVEGRVNAVRAALEAQGRAE